MAVAVLAVASVNIQPVRATGVIHLIPNSGYVGASITLTGTGFQFNERCEITFDGAHASQITVGWTDGTLDPDPTSVSAVFPVPASSAGGHIVRAVGLTSGTTATAPFYLCPTISFRVSGMDGDSSEPVLNIDGTDYNEVALSSLNINDWTSGSTHHVVVTDPVNTADGNKRYAFSSWTNGNGLNDLDGTFTTPAASTTVTVNYQKQWQTTFTETGLTADASSTVLSVGTANYVYGDFSAGSLTTWINHGTAYTWQTVAGGANERFVTTASSGSVTGASSFSATYYQQWHNQFAALGLSGADTVVLTGVSLGVSTTLATLTADGSYQWVWCDNGENTLTCPISSTLSGLTERWSIGGWGGSFIGVGGLSIALTYYHQYKLAVTGGNGIVYGGDSSRFDDMWYDVASVPTVTSNWVWGEAAGTRTALTNWQLDSVDQNPARQYTGTLTATITMNAAHTINFVSETQYQVTFSASGLDANSAGTTVLTVGSTGYQYDQLASANGWLDAGTTFSWASPISGGAGKQFILHSSAGVSSPLTGSGTAAATYYAQYTITPYYTVNGGGTPTATNVVHYTSNGASVTATPTLGSSGGTAIWADSGTAITYDSPIAGGAGERWQISSGDTSTHQVLASVTSSQTITAAYTHQICNAFKATGLSGSDTTVVTGTQFGLTVSTVLDSSNFWQMSEWVNYGSVATFAASSTISTSNERWATEDVSTAAITSGGNTYTKQYIHQYQTTFQYTIAGGAAGSTSPTAYYTQFGADASTTAAIDTSVSDWVDAGTVVTYTNPLGGSDVNTRWQANLPITADKSVIDDYVDVAQTLNPTYYRQHSVRVHLEDLSGEVSTNVYGTSFGDANSVNLALDSTNGWVAACWMDADTEFTIPCTLIMSENEQWILGSGNGISETVSGPLDLPISGYCHLWRNLYAVTGLSGDDTVTIMGTYLNLPWTIATLSASNGWTAYTWSDDGAVATFPVVSSVSTASERWAIGNAYSTGAVSFGGGTYSQAYTHQYNVAFHYSTSDAKAIPNGIAIGSYRQFGNAVPLQAGPNYRTTNPASDWVDNGTTVIFTPATNTANTERWTLPTSTTEYLVTAPETISCNGYRHQVGNTFTAKGLSGTDAAAIMGYYDGYVINIAALNSANGWATFAWSDGGRAVIYQSMSQNSGADERWFTPTELIMLGEGGKVIEKAYLHQYKITFTATGLDDSQNTATIAAINGQPITYAQLPYATAWLNDSSTITWAFQTTITGSDGTQSTWSRTSGLSQTKQSGTLTASSSGTITAAYHTQYKITVETAEHGTITPATTYADSGSSQTFTVTADSGYHITDVTVDGKSVGTQDSWEFSDIQNSHTISATFAEDQPDSSVQLNLYLTITLSLAAASILAASLLLLAHRRHLF